MIKRRQFITLLGGAVAWPVAAHAQQSTIPVIGLLRATSENDSQQLLASFREGLGSLQFMEGQNVLIEYRWAEGNYDRLSTLIADLMDKRVAVLIVGGNPAAIAAKNANLTLPVVFAVGGDPQKLGLVDSLNRPGRNFTGVSFFAPQLEGKRLGLMHELVPKATTVAVLVNPKNPPASTQIAEVREAARVLALKVNILTASTEPEIEIAFEKAVDQGAGALAVAADPYFFSQREKLIGLAARYKLPAIYEGRPVAVAGGLASYGTSLPEAYRNIGTYAGRLLKGEKVLDLPVMQSTKFEFVINLKTAKVLGLEVPPMLSARADEVIE